MEKILVVIDMQNDFIDGTLGSKEAPLIVHNVCEKIKMHEGPIFVTRDTHFEDYLTTREGKLLPIKHCIKGTRGWEICDEVNEALGKKTDVTYFDKAGFGSLDIPHKIEALIKEKDFCFEVLGLCTDICVVVNALVLKVAFPEVEIYVDSKCCAGVTPEKHEAALETMRSCQIIVE